MQRPSFEFQDPHRARSMVAEIEYMLAHPEEDDLTLERIMQLEEYLNEIKSRLQANGENT